MIAADPTFVGPSVNWLALSPMLVMLGAAMGDQIVIHVSGEGAEKAMDQLAELVESRFGED